MKKAKTAPVDRYYARADCMVDVIPSEDGPDAALRLIKMRFHTSDMSSGKIVGKSATAWVTMTLPQCEQLATQLSALAEIAKRWKPGSPPQMIGQGIELRGPFDDD